PTRLTIAFRGSAALFAGSAGREDSPASSALVDGKALITLSAWRPYVVAYLPINRPANAGWAEALVADSALSNRRYFGRQQEEGAAPRARSARTRVPGIHG